MQEAVQSSLASWQNFYVIVGSAAATLTGLIFVVATLAASMRRREAAPSETTPSAAFAAFNTPNIVHFGAALLVAALLTAPWPTLWMAGLLLGLLGFLGICYMGIVLYWARHQLHYQPVLEDWLWHIVFPLFAYLALLVAAIMLSDHSQQALFAIAAATVLLLFIGIHNAWDNVTYITVELAQRHPTDQDE